MYGVLIHVMDILWLQKVLVFFTYHTNSEYINYCKFQLIYSRFFFVYKTMFFACVMFGKIYGFMSHLLHTVVLFSVDAWDGQGDEPVVYHGHTLTSKVPLKSVIEAINEYAFVTSEYVS